MSHNVNDPDYVKVCNIVDRLIELDVSSVLGDLIINLCFNYDEAKDYILNYHSDILDEEL